MSNPDLFLEDLRSSTFEIVKRPTLKFQTESLSSCSSNSHNNNSQDKRGEKENGKNIQEIIEKCHNNESGIVVVLTKQAAASSSSEEEEEEKLKVVVEDELEEEDGFRTPTSLDHRIPVATECPPAPRKTKPSLKRKAPPSSNHCNNCRHPLDLSKVVELLLFPAQQQHVPLSHISYQSTKKIRRGEPK